MDVVFGGAPCQGFSLIGQRVLDVPRNALVREFVRLVKELNAHHFVFENVKGLTLGPQRQFLEELISSFDEIGYEIRTPWRVLNASAYGVPQDRERLILLGARKGLQLPDYPAPHTRQAGDGKGPAHLQPGPTCRDALDDLPDAELFDELNDSDSVAASDWGQISPYAAEMRALNSRAWHHGYRRRWDKRLLTASARTDHSEISRRRFVETAPGKIEPISRFFKLHPQGVANTRRAGSDSARGAFTSPRPIHYRLPRCITVREMARLHGFPDWFRFHVTKWHGARQIGNAVPPPLARAVATSVLAAAGLEPESPREVLALGATPLLHMDMSEASRYWGIPIPIGNRDRKSGQKKRSQLEIEILRNLSLSDA